jgi:chromatin remodeling complex protein RSC6
MNYALQKLRPSPQLAAIVGAQPITRPEVVHRVLEYIREHNLQIDARVMPDAKLAEVIGPESVPVLEMTRALERNLRSH